MDDQLTQIRREKDEKYRQELEKERLQNGVISDIVVLVSRYRPERREYIDENVDYFVDRSFVVNPIFPVKILLHNICRDVGIVPDRARLWISKGGKHTILDSEKTPIELNLENNDKIILEVKTQSGIWVKEESKPRTYGPTGTSNNDRFFPNDPMFQHQAGDDRVLHSPQPSLHPTNFDYGMVPNFPIPNNSNQNQEISNIMGKFFQGYNQNPNAQRDFQLEEALRISKEQADQERRKYEKLENALVSRNLKIYPVSDDGNCLFRSISYQVHGTVDKYADVRQQIVNYIRSASEDYINFVTEDFDYYLTKMSCDGEYGTNLEVQASVEVFNRPMEVYSDESGAEPMNIFQGDYYFNKPIRVSYHRGNHYNAVIPMDVEENVVPPTGFAQFEPKTKTDYDFEPIRTDEIFTCPYCNHICPNYEDIQIHMLTSCEVGSSFV